MCEDRTRALAFTARTSHGWARQGGRVVPTGDTDHRGARFALSVGHVPWMAVIADVDFARVVGQVIAPASGVLAAFDHLGPPNIRYRHSAFPSEPTTATAASAGLRAVHADRAEADPASPDGHRTDRAPTRDATARRSSQEWSGMGSSSVWRAKMIRDRSHAARPLRNDPAGALLTESHVRKGF